MTQTLPERTATILSGVDYSPGRRFVVVARHALLTGWVHGTGFTPGFGVEWSSAASEAAGAVHVQLSPDQGGPWAHHPRVGFLEPLGPDV